MVSAPSVVASLERPTVTVALPSVSTSARPVKLPVDKSAELIYLENYEKELLSTDENNVIFKHKILKSNLKDDLKRIIIKNINYFNTLNEYSSEYQKMSSWIKNMEKIPFGNYVNLPVSYESSKSYNFINLVLSKSVINCS